MQKHIHREREREKINVSFSSKGRVNCSHFSAYLTFKMKDTVYSEGGKYPKEVLASDVKSGREP